jgi:hypothetical protein
VCKASIAAALVAFGIIALVQEGTNAMVTPPAGLLPALTIPAIETAALRRDVRVTRHVAVRQVCANAIISFASRREPMPLPPPCGRARRALQR